MLGGFGIGFIEIGFSEGNFGQFVFLKTADIRSDSVADTNFGIRSERDVFSGIVSDHGVIESDGCFLSDIVGFGNRNGTVAGIAQDSTFDQRGIKLVDLIEGERFAVFYVFEQGFDI